MMSSLWKQSRCNSPSETSTDILPSPTNKVFDISRHSLRPQAFLDGRVRHFLLQEIIRAAISCHLESLDSSATQLTITYTDENVLYRMLGLWGCAEDAMYFERKK